MRVTCRIIDGFRTQDGESELRAEQCHRITRLVGVAAAKQVVAAEVVVEIIAFAQSTTVGSGHGSGGRSG